MNLNCPLPSNEPDNARRSITMSHGGGGKLSQDLLNEIFLPAFRNSFLEEVHDGAVLPPFQGPIAFTSDAHVVRPLFFPGGDLGLLALYGSINDLAMCGAQAKYFSMSFILEEGLSFGILKQIVHSISAAAKAAQVLIVTGDTKVVEKGLCDGMYLSTSGIGEVKSKFKIAPKQIRPGDSVIVSGDIGRHGTAILAHRQGFQMEGDLVSDCAPLWTPVESLLQAGVQIHCLRDLTRGGLAAACSEISQASGLSMELIEKQIPVSDSVRGVCEILGLDPIHIPNEGRFVLFVPEDEEATTLKLLRELSISSRAEKIGCVLNSALSGGLNGGLNSVFTSGPQVWLRGPFGQRRLLVLPSGEQLPRIC